MSVSVTESDFNLGEEYQKTLDRSPELPGAVVQFVGLVRDFNQDTEVVSLELQHYSGMTESVIEDICNDARRRWSISEPSVIHRVGKLKPRDQIVLVSVASAHRSAAFSACEFIMDQLKTKATFWKKETRRQDGKNSCRWLAMKDSDNQRAKRWDEKN